MWFTIMSILTWKNWSSIRGSLLRTRPPLNSEKFRTAVRFLFKSTTRSPHRGWNFIFFEAIFYIKKMWHRLVNTLLVISLKDGVWGWIRHWSLIEVNVSFWMTLREDSCRAIKQNNLENTSLHNFTFSYFVWIL